MKTMSLNYAIDFKEALHVLKRFLAVFFVWILSEVYISMVHQWCGDDMPVEDIFKFRYHHASFNRPA